TFFPGSGQSDGVSRPRCPFEVALLVWGLSCCLLRRSTSVGSEIDEKTEAHGGQGNFGRLAKYRRPCRCRKLGPGQDPRNRSGDCRGGDGEADRLSNRLGMAAAMDSD